MKNFVFCVQEKRRIPSGIPSIDYLQTELIFLDMTIFMLFKKMLYIADAALNLFLRACTTIYQKSNLLKELIYAGLKKRSASAIFHGLCLYRLSEKRIQRYGLALTLKMRIAQHMLVLSKIPRLIAWWRILHSGITNTFLKSCAGKWNTINASTQTNMNMSGKARLRAIQMHVYSREKSRL